MIDRAVRPHGAQASPRPATQSARVGLIDLGSHTGEPLRKLISEQLALPRNKRSLWPAVVPAAGPLAALAPMLTSGNVFLATANPATLMSIGTGYGSAVLHGGRIVAHAPFVAASSALLPVVTPVVLLVTLSAIAMSARFDRLQSTVDWLADAVGELLKRDVGADFGLLLSAQDRLRDLAAECDESHRFTDEMKVRLSLLERDLGVLYRKYEVLLQATPRTDIDAASAVHNQRIFALATIASFGLDQLRLKLAFQDNPADLERRTQAVEERHRTYMHYFRALAHGNPLEKLKRDVVEELDEMIWLTRHVFDRRRATKLEKTSEAADGALGNLRPLLDQLRSLCESIEEPSPLGQSILYLRGQGSGELKAFYGDFELRETNPHSQSENGPPEPGRRGQHPH